MVVVVVVVVVVHRCSELDCFFASCLYAYTCLCMHTRMSVCLSVCLPACLPVYLRYSTEIYSAGAGPNNHRRGNEVLGCDQRDIIANMVHMIHNSCLCHIKLEPHLHSKLNAVRRKSEQGMGMRCVLAIK